MPEHNVTVILHLTRGAYAPMLVWLDQPVGEDPPGRLGPRRRAQDRRRE